MKMKTIFQTREGLRIMHVIRKEGESAEGLIHRFNTLVRQSNIFHELKLAGLPEKQKKRAILQLRRGKKF